MGVYIPTMIMPSDCDYCDLYQRGYCCAKGARVQCEEGVDADCPLVEVEVPHGKLIDGDRFYEEFEPNSWSEGMAVSTYIKKAPTVIEAEVE